MDFRRYDRALIRNLHETHRGILEERALTGLEAPDSYHGIDFFRLAYYALFNDMVAHCMKVLDRHPGCASFWYLYKTDQNSVDSFVKKKSFDWDSLERLSDNLRCIRNGTHFHIDKEKVFDPKKVWRVIKKRKELVQGMHIIWSILQHLYQKRFNKEFTELNLSYDGTDATEIVNRARNAGIISR